MKAAGFEVSHSTGPVPRTNTLHNHRQNHNSSKLPAFRFADLKKDSLALPLPSLGLHIPPSPADSTAGEDDNSLTTAAATTSDSQNSSTGTARPLHQHHTHLQRHPSQNLDAQHSSSLLDYQQIPLQPQQIQTTNATTTTVAPQLPLTSQPQVQNNKEQIQSPSRPSPRSRASTFQTAVSSTGPVKQYSANHKRPASFPDSPKTTAPSATHDTSTKNERDNIPATRLVSGPSTIGKPQTRNASALDGANGIEPSLGLPPTLLSGQQDSNLPQTLTSARATKEWAQGQRELLLPKTLQLASPIEETSDIIANTAATKRTSIAGNHRPPPVSFKPFSASANSSTSSAGSTTPVRVPPIRGFRSSGSRRSLVIDMNTARPVRGSSYGYDASGLPDDYADPTQRDRTLRALEGLSPSEDEMMLQLTPPDSAERMASGEGDDSTDDIFLKIARQEPTARALDERSSLTSAEETQSTVSRVVRSSHRRPLSAAVPVSALPTSPPRITRRLSDQQETQRNRVGRLDDDGQADSATKALTYRALAREKAASIYPGEDLSRSKTVTASSRPALVAPRSYILQDGNAEALSSGRRRQSITENSGGLPPRTSSYRQSNLSHGRTYNSSPLVRNSIEQQGSDLGHGVEGTESTLSNAATSNFWDDLDDLKSRIHRLEMTSKLPSTSGGAMSRVSDDRPATAATSATTISTSPKRASGNAAQQNNDATSTTSSQKEGQPILLSAIKQSKAFVSPEVFAALESVAAEALALSSMMGSAGQPGPISSGASTVGGLGVTDRQLRRRAEGVCRGLTELAIALSDDSSQQKTVQVGGGTPVKDVAMPTTPTLNKTFAGLTAAHQRRSSITLEQNPLRNAVTSPRATTRLEERRGSLLGSGSMALPSPRFVSVAASNAVPATPTETVGRRSSLMVARSRRAGTEEPPADEGRKSSLLLRTRRAGTEEPEEGRKTSLLRGRRGTLGEDDEEAARFRAPSRATTEVNAATTGRVLAQIPAPDTTALGQSALPRRRLVPSTLNTRLVAPAATVQTASPGRRYLDRPGTDAAGLDKTTDDRAHGHQRQLSLGQTVLLNRAGSLSRRRESGIPSVPGSASAANYR